MDVAAQAPGLPEDGAGGEPVASGGTPEASGGHLVDEAALPGPHDEVVVVVEVVDLLCGGGRPARGGVDELERRVARDADRELPSVDVVRVQETIKAIDGSACQPDRCR
ncbi:hypothetical protein ASD90_11215 [Terrabacter sp. Root181]|nr:hypothetical protein ASD90_11215 [Terrabacter sp. Root181]